MSENGWHEYKLLVLEKFEVIHEDIKGLDDKMTNYVNRLAHLESKVSNIYSVAIFSSIIVGLLISVANLVISNFL